MLNNFPVVLVDVDYTVALLHKRWLELYNRDFEDNLTEADITEWQIDKFVKPQCGNKIYDYLLLPDLYDKVEIRSDAKSAINCLRENDFKVVFLTAGIHRGKYDLLRNAGLLTSEAEIIYATDKSMVYGDFMVDDYPENLKAFKFRNPKGVALLFDAPHNQGYERRGIIRISTLTRATVTIRYIREKPFLQEYFL